MRHQLYLGNIHYTPNEYELNENGKINEDYLYQLYLYDEAKNTIPFHIGARCDNKPATQIQCLICGSTSFEIGKGSYFTAIRCVNCRWEACIHEG